MAEFSMAARLTIDVVAHIEADDAEDAERKFDAGDFSWNHAQGELVDWESSSEPEED